MDVWQLEGREASFDVNARLRNHIVRTSYLVGCKPRATNWNSHTYVPEPEVDNRLT